MAQLRIFKKNEGKVYDLVMAQKKKEQREQAQQLQDELICEMRTNGNRYDDVWDSNLTVISKGHKTVLYRALRAFVG